MGTIRSTLTITAAGAAMLVAFAAGNFAQAQDDIIAPKTSTRGNVYEAYITHRINPHFIVKGDYIRYDAQWSGSGWDVGAPQKLSGTPNVLGFPTFDSAYKFALSMIARF